MGSKRERQTVEPSIELNGITLALLDGCKLHGFRSGGGLRVFYLKRGEIVVGYGEHPEADEALRYADEDFLAGGRDYKSVYGKRYKHYLTGSSQASGPLDSWILRGHTLDASRDNEGNVIVELKGWIQTEIPQEVEERAKHQEVLWKNRGYTYQLSPAFGGQGVNIREISRPEGKEAGWSYRGAKTGKDKTFKVALEKALESPVEELSAA